MNNLETIDKIASSINALSQDVYKREELLPEYFKLQQEIVNLTFNEEHADRGNLKLWDVYAHFEKMNEERGHVADAALKRFKVNCDILINLIKAEISGRRGEQMAFTKLEQIEGPKYLLTNLELGTRSAKCEIDAVVITTKGIFIVEVKNTKKNIFIDENGDYYRNSEYMNLDTNIGEKMDRRESMVRAKLLETGILDVEQAINIEKIIVFTNNSITVRNKLQSLRSCFLSELQCVIEEYDGPEVLSEEIMSNIATTLENFRHEEYYPTGLNTSQFKKDFATVLALLEDAPQKELEETIVENAIKDEKDYGEWKEQKKEGFRKIFTGKNTRFVSAIVLVITCALGGVIVKSIRNMHRKY